MLDQYGGPRRGSLPPKKKKPVVTQTDFNVWDRTHVAAPVKPTLPNAADRFTAAAAAALANREKEAQAQILARQTAIRTRSDPHSLRSLGGPAPVNQVKAGEQAETMRWAQALASAAREMELKASFDQARNTRDYLDTFGDVSPGVMRAEGYHAPSVSDIWASTGAFNVNNPNHVRYLQGKMAQQGLPVKIDGVFGPETVSAAVEWDRLDKERQLTDRATWIQDNLVKTGFLKGTSARQAAASLLSPMGGFQYRRELDAAFTVWAEAQRGGGAQASYTLYKDKWARAFVGLPGFVDVASIRNLIALPSGVEAGYTALGFDADLAMYEAQDRARAAMRAEAAKSPSLWAKSGGRALAFLGTELEAGMVDQGLRGQAVRFGLKTMELAQKPSILVENIFLNAARMAVNDPLALVPFAQSDPGFGRDYWRSEAFSFEQSSATRALHHEHPVLGMGLQVLLDPLMYLGGVGLIGKGARGLMELSRVAKVGGFADDALQLGRAGRTIETLSHINRARDLVSPLWHAGLTETERVMMDVSWYSGAHGFWYVQEPLQGAVDFAHLMGQKSSSALEAVRLTKQAAIDGVLDAAGKVIAREKYASAQLAKAEADDALRANLEAGFQKFKAEARPLGAVVNGGPDPRVVKAIETRTIEGQVLLDAHTGLARTVIKELPAVVELAQGMGDRLYAWAPDGTRGLTRAGNKLQAHLYDRAKEAAVAAAVADGVVSREEARFVLGQHHMIPARADLATTFNDVYLQPRLAFMNEEVLPVLDKAVEILGGPMSSGFHKVMVNGVETQVYREPRVHPFDRYAEDLRRLLRDEKVKVHNPQWEYAHTSTGRVWRPLYFSEGQMEAAKSAEKRMWVAHWRSEWSTQKLLGQVVGSPEAQAKILSQRLADIDSAWKMAKNPHGRWGWIDTREELEIPALYTKNRWVDPSLWRTGDTGLNAEDFVNNPLWGGVQAVVDVRDQMDSLMRVFGGGGSFASSHSDAAFLEEFGRQGNDIARKTQAMAARKTTPWNARKIGKEGEDLGPLPVGRLTADLTWKKGARVAETARLAAEQAMSEKTLRPLFDNVFVAKRNLEAVDEAALYAKNGLYLRALEHSRIAPLRLAYKSFAAATSIWKTATLPLRLGWVTRNVFDNMSKLWVAGVRDPRVFFAGHFNGGNIFGEYPLYLVVALADHLDTMTGSTAGPALRTMIAWWRDADQGVMAKVFALEGIPVPAEVVDGAFTALEPGMAKAARLRVAETRATIKARGEWDAFQEAKFLNDEARYELGQASRGLWSLFGSRVENHYRKGLYRWQYAKRLEEGWTAADASNDAIRLVNETLFDYSDPNVLESNLQAFAPFISFWSRNIAFWAEAPLDHPWVLSTISRYNQGLEAINKDKPEWMRRYLSTDKLGDALAAFPELRWLGRVFQDQNFDPINLFSFSPLWRAFKSENQNLTSGADESQMGFIGSFIDSMDRYGLGSNPFLRKPAEAFGLVPAQLWKHVFPQTDMLMAFTMQWWRGRQDGGFDIEALLADPILKAMGMQTLSEFNHLDMELQVTAELARQAERGEPADEAAARFKIENVVALQTLFGYFSGVYTRTITPEDVALYTAVEEYRTAGAAGDGLQAYLDQKGAHPGLDAFRRYMDQKNNPETAYGPADAVAFARWMDVRSVWEGFQETPYKDRPAYMIEHPEIAQWVTGALTESMPKSRAIRNLQLSQENQWWGQVADRLKAGDVLNYEDSQRVLNGLVDADLRAYWERKDTPADDVHKAVTGILYRYYDDLSVAFFAIPAEDYAAKDAFKLAHPDLEAHWNRSGPDTVGAGALGLVKAANATLRSAWGVLMDGGHMDAANEFLKKYPFIFEWTSAEDRVTEGGQWVWKKFRDQVGVRETWDTWAAGHPFEAASFHFWEKYYALPLAGRPDFVKEFGVRFGFSPRTQAYGAQLSEQVLAKMVYRGSKLGSQHAKDYLAIKPLLDAFFALGDAGKSAFLEDHPALQAFFDRYGKGRGGGGTAHSRAYVAVKAELDTYFNMTDFVERTVFFESHPEIGKYLREYGKPFSEDPELNKLIQGYYDLPVFSGARKTYLREHPEMQVYFDEKASVEQSAISDLLDVYFSLARKARPQFLMRHPELDFWFLERRSLKASLETSRKEYDWQNLPRLRDAYAKFADIYLPEAEGIRRSLAADAGAAFVGRRQR